MMHYTYKGILLLPSQLLPSSNNYAIIIIIVTNIILIVMITQQKSPINNHLCLYMSVKKICVGKEKICDTCCNYKSRRSADVDSVTQRMYLQVKQI